MFAVVEVIENAVNFSQEQLDKLPVSTLFPELCDEAFVPKGRNKKYGYLFDFIFVKNMFHLPIHNYFCYLFFITIWYIIKHIISFYFRFISETKMTFWYFIETHYDIF